MELPGEDIISYFVKFRPVYDESKITGVSVTATDISFFAEQAKSLEHLAATDPLTGAYNIRGFFDLMQKELSQAQRQDYDVAIFMVDLDYLKQINDMMEHSAGDKALKEIADYLTGNFRKEDIVARYGGDEFIVGFTNVQDEESLYQKIQETVEEIRKIRIISGNLNQTLSVSAGVYIVESGVNLDFAVKKAGLALYQAKKNGRNQACFYDSLTQESIKIE